MKNRIFFAVFLLLTHLGAWGQIGGDYNPSNPSDPGTPIQKYTLTLNATPSGGGSFNTTSTKVAVGENYNLRAYPNSDYNFVAWLCDGDTISKSASYNYVMPAHNVDITGVFVYNPNSPSDPEDQPLKYQLSLTASPMNSGSFNFSNERLAAGSVNSLRAYTNTDFVFKQWMMGDSVLSTSQSMDFVMPAHNVQIVGLFEYNPASPENPNKNYWNKETGEVIVDDFTPNSLYSAISNAIGNSSRDDVSMIIVAGKMGDNDFGIANNFSKCSLLDLSRTTGVTEIPSYAFDYTNLESVYLPATVEKIGYRAFADCSQLLSLTVYAMTPPVLDSYVFDGVQEGLVVYVPAGAIPQYQEAEGWKNFTLLPIQEDIRNLTVNLPAGTNVADYAQMWLELTNTKNGQRIHYVMTDKTAYTFMNIIRNTSWNITLCNQSGDVFGKIDNVEVKDEDVTVTFASLTQPKSVNLSVKTPDGQDVTQQTQITWTNAEGKYLSQGCSLTGLPVGYQTKYKVILSEQLAMLYNVPAETEYTLTATDNNPVCQLTAIGQVKVSGKVVDKNTNQPVSGAVISASQTFGGKYSKTFSCKTDNKGEYSIDLYKVPSSIAFSAADYVSQTLGCDSIVDASGALAMQDVALKEIAGAVISLSLTYTPCAEDGETAEVQNWFNDYNNVGYTLYNKTKNRTISQFNVQYPQIVLLEEVADGDELLLTATSKTGAFMPVQENVVIAEQAAEATVNIIELGKIDAAFSKNINSSVKGILYDGNGKLVKSYDYAQASLSIGNLTDGSYTLVSMGDSKLFSSIYDLSQFSQAGLTEGTDYVKNTVAVQSGKISKISIEEIPTFNESKLYYTGENTSFTVNKSSIVAGNYLTLSGRIDFKPAYVSSVSNIQMVVDLPENCSFVENSVMVGNSTSSYTLNGTRLTIPVARLNDRIRFCVIPTLGGDYAPSAFAQFDMNGETITQPIGSANYTAKDLSIVVPSTVAKTAVHIGGTAIGKCDIEIYDNNILIGQTRSLANGTWATSVELNEPYNMSTHRIYAKITTKQKIELTSNVVECIYDKNSIQVSKVRMIYRDQDFVFDFQNPPVSFSPYSYNPSYPDFTFLIDFTKNDTTIIKNVRLNVFTSNNEVIYLYPKYDIQKDKYIVKGKFGSYSLPRNVSVNFDDCTNFTEENVNDIGFDKVKDGNYTIIQDNPNVKSFLLQDNNKNPLFYHNMILEGLDKEKAINYLSKINAELILEMDSILLYTYKGNSYINILKKKSDVVNAYICLDDKDIWERFTLSCLQSPLYLNKQKNDVEEDPFKPQITDPLGWLRDAPLKGILNEARRKYPCNDQEMLDEAVKQLRCGSGFLGASAAANTIATTSSIHGGDIYGSISNGMTFGNGTDGIMRNANFWKNYIHNLPECNPPLPNDIINPDVPHVIDPSGYVYEAVATNRLEGVTATCFYKETVEDMYGDLHENIVKWDAAEYAQENPLFTDEYGMYRWDVPKGLWQVKFEKEGYETTYSEWLPVPPPQLDVNIAMKQNVQPVVKNARAFEDAVEVEFDKYMIPELLNTDNILVMADGKALEGKVELLNEEVSYEGNTDTYASKIRFNAVNPFPAKDVTLLVKNQVKSYAGIRMQEDYQQDFTVEQEVRKIACDSLTTVIYGEAAEVTVSVLPAAASAGKTLNVKALSNIIISVDEQQLTLDEDGKASFLVKGELPGTSALTFSMDGYDVSATTIVSVETESSIVTAMPKASIASGSEVGKDTEVYLSCDTEGATIYYTLDGSCPCDEAGSRKVYDGEPIIISQSVTIKAMAVVKGKTESDVAEFVYTVVGDGIDDVTVNGKIHIYPLPVRDKLNVVAGGKTIKSVTVSSLNGVQVAASNTAATAVTLNVGNIAAGIYIVNVKTENGNYNRKIVKL